MPRWLITLLLLLLTACTTPGCGRCPVAPTPDTVPLSAEEQALADLLHVEGDLPAGFSLIKMRPPMPQLVPGTHQRASLWGTWWLPPLDGTHLEVNAHLDRYQTAAEARRVHAAYLSDLPAYGQRLQESPIGEAGGTTLEHMTPGNPLGTIFTIYVVHCDTRATLTLIRTEDYDFLLDYAERLDARLKVAVC